jgi:hypothetical protein
MTTDQLQQLAREWIAEQGDDAGMHLAEAIRELRAVGDRKGARLLGQIARAIDLVDGDGRTPARRMAIRRTRNDPAT